jgi:hypothetical protein
MEEGLSRITSAIKHAVCMPVDPKSTNLQEAVQLVGCENGLTVPKKLALIKYFQGDSTAVDAYLVLEGNKLQVYF